MCQTVQTYIERTKNFICKAGNEECEDCKTFTLHDHNKDNLDNTCEVCNSWNFLDKLVKENREIYRKYAEKATETDPVNEVTLSADLEKIIMLSRLEMFKQIIFAPRLTIYNQTFAPVGKNSKIKPLAVLWHSAITGRNKEDIVSTFNMFFHHYKNTKKFVLWLDNCSAHNKNWCLFKFFVKIVNLPEIAATEKKIYFFELGHSFMSADSFHHQVELSLKAQKKPTILMILLMQ